jgi:proteic killer suppression protein
VHKSLRKFYASGITAGIQKKHEHKLRLILANLDQAEESDDMDLPGLFMHQLKDDRKDIWSVRVSGNWRIPKIIGIARRRQMNETP